MQRGQSGLLPQQAQLLWSVCGFDRRELTPNGIGLRGLRGCSTFAGASLGCTSGTGATAVIAGLGLCAVLGLGSALEALASATTGEHESVFASAHIAGGV
jgi:hypothetical protein